MYPSVHVGDGTLGHDAHAPYDRVIATCSVGSVPTAWREQTKPGGRIVTPWGPTYGGEAVARLSVDEDGSASGSFVRSSAFMRMDVQRKRLPPTRAYLDGQGWPATGVTTDTGLSPDDVGDWIPGRTRLSSAAHGLSGMSWKQPGAGGPSRAVPASNASASQ
ncbi:hypothetical protein [Streptomyces mayonensis]|uniref:hypothetical protein n=1 Tax=Streptomyces mayonensis TaxID=2750816 RepID=UPI0027E3F9FB|nr:hypothetical protein [Streptomyces sp. A108]